MERLQIRCGKVRLEKSGYQAGPASRHGPATGYLNL
jgi:hypothetical protein